MGKAISDALTNQILSLVKDAEIQGVSLTSREIGERVGLSASAVRVRLHRVRSQHVEPRPAAKPAAKTPAKPVKPSAKPLPPPEFSTTTVDVAELRGRVISKVIEAGQWRKVGLVADTHLCCREERLAELHATYDMFAHEGITEVFHAGNLVDGHIARINGASVLSATPDGQAEYAAKHYPQRPGITTYFITGDDHEGWWIKDGWSWGEYFENICRKRGRSDMVYIGHVEADVEFRAPRGSAIMKVQHPGGGSAYARSYTGQKSIESFEGGEKPSILVQGHYHVSNFMQDRNVYVISMPGFQDQTIFARKKRLRMEVGGAILRFCQTEDGAIHRCQLEWIRYFTRDYWRSFIGSDEFGDERGPKKLVFHL